MPRRKYKRINQSRNRFDAKYNNQLVASTINLILRQGKKNLAENIIYDALDFVEKKTGDDKPLRVFELAVKNILPSVYVKSKRIGGATYQVPIEIPHEKRYSLALRWLVQYSRERKGKSMAERLAEEIVDASQNKGGSIKKKQDTHKMAEANKAYSHYRF